MGAVGLEFLRGRLAGTRDQGSQCFTVFIRELHKADAHSKGGVILIHAVGIRPDHFAADAYGVMFAGKNRHAIGLIEAQRLLAKDKQPIRFASSWRKDSPAGLAIGRKQCASLKIEGNGFS